MYYSKTFLQCKILSNIPICFMIFLNNHFFEAQIFFRGGMPSCPPHGRPWLYVYILEENKIIIIWCNYQADNTHRVFRLWMNFTLPKINRTYNNNMIFFQLNNINKTIVFGMNKSKTKVWVPPAKETRRQNYSFDILTHYKTQVGAHSLVRRYYHTFFKLFLYLCPKHSYRNTSKCCLIFLN